MTARLWAILSCEAQKAIRQKFTYLGPALLLVAVFCAPLMHPIRHDDVTDYGFLGYATPLALNLIGVLVLLVYSANLVSSELGSGTIRMVVVRPIHRYEIIVAKLVLGMGYAVCLTVLACAASVALAYWFGNLDAVRSGDEVVYTSGQMASAFALAVLVNFATQFATVAYGVMISSLTTSTGAAVGASVGIWVLLDAIKYPLGIAPYLFTSYMESSWRVFQDRLNLLPEAHWFPTTGYCLLTSGVAAALFIAVAIWSFGRKDLNA